MGKREGKQEALSKDRVKPLTYCWQCSLKSVEHGGRGFADTKCFRAYASKPKETVQLSSRHLTNNYFRDARQTTKHVLLCIQL